MTPNFCCYSATQPLLHQQCMHACCVQSLMGSFVAETTFSARACMYLCVCGLPLAILVPVVSLTWSLARWLLSRFFFQKKLGRTSEEDFNATRQKQQIYQLLGRPNLWLHCLHCWYLKLRRKFWQHNLTQQIEQKVYTRYITCYIPVIYLLYTRFIPGYQLSAPGAPGARAHLVHFWTQGKIRICSKVHSKNQDVHLKYTLQNMKFTESAQKLHTAKHDCALKYPEKAWEVHTEPR